MNLIVDNRQKGASTFVAIFIEIVMPVGRWTQRNLKNSANKKKV